MKKRITIALAAIALLLLPLSAEAKFSLPRWVTFWKKPKTETVDTTSVKKKSPYDKLFAKEDAKAEGLISIHRVGKKLYFELPIELLGREFLMGSTIAKISDNAFGVVGAKDNLLHFTFTQVDSTILLREIDASYIPGDEGIGAALSNSHIGAIRNAFPRKAFNNDSTAVVFEVTPLFLGDDKDASPFSPYGVYASYDRSEQYKSALSSIVGFKAFEDNVSVTSSLSYTITLRNPSTGRTLMRNEPFTAELTRSIILLPEKPYHPRMGDPRIGYFVTQRTMLGDTEQSSRDIFFANRWRLEPSDSAAYRRGELVEPAKPIVFYIDSNFPETWKPYIRSAVSLWCEPFEKIGFKNAVIARDFPADDPSFDPDNIKYSCIRYAPIGIQNAMGPSWVDPRSGEIITASVYVYHDVIKLVGDWRFAQTAQADPAVRKRNIPEDILGDALNYVIRHEVGHCLGLMHNMSGSSVIPVESLRDPEFTSAHGTTTSIMDYARNNYIAQPGDYEKGVRLTPPTFGSYDYWAIRWGYTPIFDAESLEQEGKITESWITDSLKAAPFYRYGKQQLAFAFFDPSCQNEDLGDDVILASRYGVKNLKYINSNFMDWIEDSLDNDYEYRTELYQAIVNQYARYIGHLARNVGGLYRREIKVGDGQKRFENVPRSKQLACIDELFAMWNDADWIGSDKVCSRLPIVGTPVHAVRSAIQSQLLNTPFACSNSDGVESHQLSSQECFDIISARVWGPTRSRKKLTAEQRDFQSDFVDNYLKTANFAVPKGGQKVLSEDYAPISKAYFCSIGEGENLTGEICYSPVAGYEYFPRAIFNRGDVTVPAIYAVLSRARSDMKAALSSASATDKAHYELLISKINYGIGK